MIYYELAKEFFQKMQLMQKSGLQRQINEGTHGEAFALHCIKEKQDETVPSGISTAMGISTARVAAALNSLESKGFITREIDLDDRRRIIVRLTPKGRDIADEQEKFFVNMITNVLMGLGEQDAKDYVRITGRLAEVFQKLEIQPINKGGLN